jgi:hypothetical protein
MDRLNESFSDDFEHAIERGKANKQCVKEMQQWCKHFRIEMKSSGLYAQMSGLPIGLHEISCPYTACQPSASNLPWICSDFLIKACDGCEYHEPNGDDSWGQKIISDHKERVRLRAEEEKKRVEEVDRLRSELRAQSQSIGSASELQSQRIAVFLEEMFSDNSAVQDEAVARLKQAAQVGADLFPESAIDLLINMFHYEEFNKSAIEICAELAGKQTGQSQKFESAALNAIRSKQHPHHATSILVRLEKAANYPLDVECIQRLLLSQYHDVPIGNWGDRKPDYSATTEVLVRSYDANEDSFLDLLRNNLQHDNDELRKHFCGALNLLQQKRPAIVQRILPELMKSLERYEKKDITHGGPSGKIIKVFQWAFRIAPKLIDDFLAEDVERVRPTVQKDIINVYRDQFIDRDLNWHDRRGREETDISEAERIAIGRLLKWIKNDRMEPEVRWKAAEALDIACSYATGAMVKEFDYLLGYYALLCEQQEPPPAPPRILLPGEEDDNATLAGLNIMSRRQHWEFFKRKIVECLEELCKVRPREVFELIFGCLNQPNAQLGEEFRGTVVTLLGELGNTFGLQARALPILMRELMNYGSDWVRAKAINATIEMFNSPPPTNVVDAVLVHLRDPKVVVHQAAIRAIDWRPSWFDASQALEAIKCLAALADACRTHPDELRHICEAAIAMGRRHTGLKKYALALVESVFPTKEEYVDEKITEELVRMTDPSETIAVRVAVHVATFLAMFDRDRLNGSSDREEMIEWLHQLPVQTVTQIADKLLTLAVELAARDFWESWQFASLFAKNGLLGYEQKVLEAIRRSYPAEIKFDDIRQEVTGLIHLSSSNQCLQVGDKQAARKFLLQAAEILK